MLRAGKSCLANGAFVVSAHWWCIRRVENRADSLVLQENNDVTAVPRSLTTNSPRILFFPLLAPPFLVHQKRTIHVIHLNVPPFPYSLPLSSPHPSSRHFLNPKHIQRSIKAARHDVDSLLLLPPDRSGDQPPNPKKDLTS